MKEIDYIVIAIIAVIVIAAVVYIVKAWMSGKKCIGCPDGASCRSCGNRGCSGSCSSCRSDESGDDEVSRDDGNEGGCPYCDGSGDSENKH